MSLNDFIEFEDNVRRKMMLIDGHNLAYRNVFSSIYKDITDNGVFDYWRHLMFQSIFYLTKRFNPDQIVFAFDDKRSWRYDIYPEYKAHRKLNRIKNILEHEIFIEKLEEFISDLKLNFSNMYVIKIKGAEADDTIALLSRELVDDDITIISTDSDLNQLLNKNVKQYDPIKQIFIENINKNANLQIKIIGGDRNDNIHGINKGIGKVRAGKILEERLDNYINNLKDDEKEIVRQKYELNLKLINFDFIPTNIKNDILNEYKNYNISPLDGKKVIAYFLKHKLIKHFTDWNGNSEYFKKLS